VIIAVTAAGAVPYYSNLTTIDMRGLNDKWIAKNGINIGTRPGHTKYTTSEYLIEQNVNIIVGSPNVMLILDLPIKDPNAYIALAGATLPVEAKVLEIPLNAHFKVLVLYIKQHQYIDQCIENLGLKTYSLYE